MSQDITNTQLIDQLLSVARHAAERIEKLEEDNDRMKHAASGILPDGTPVQDMLDELKDSKAENTKLYKKLLSVKSILLTANSKTAYKCIEQAINVFEKEA